MHADVLIIGAGLSGICAAYRLQTRCPHLRYAILEARQSMGGTWDLFRYPGVRSDSDMATLGFPFEPWPGDKSMVDGESIRRYICATASKYGIDAHIRYGQRVLRAEWTDNLARWSVHLADGSILTCAFLFSAAGYYRYEAGYEPDFPGIRRFEGRIVHPQQWPEDVDVTGKRVVVIGSGATAVTLVPALLPTAAHVTMLQRSPTYILSLPGRDKLARFLPRSLARWKNILIGNALYAYARAFPGRARKFIARQLRKYFSESYIERHFKPRYNPWEQRLCFVPDADLFRALQSGSASVVTDEIETLTETGILLKSGRQLETDVIVTATGLVMQQFGGAILQVDGNVVDPARHTLYKGMMLSEVPNFAFALGYTNMSWTLRCDLIAQYVCRVLNLLQRENLRVCKPRAADPAPGPLLDFSSGYVARAAHLLPRQGRKPPWRLTQNYFVDYIQLRWGRLQDGEVDFY